MVKAEPTKKIKIKIKTRMNVFVVIAIVTFILFCVVSIINLQIDYNKLLSEQDALRSKIESYEDNIEKLQNELNQTFDDEYVKKVARDKLNYRMPEEIIFYNDLLK